MPVRGLTILVTSADRPRFHAALSLAAAQAALGGGARLYLHGPAVALLAPGGLAADEDTAWRAAGQPTLAGLLDEALALGVSLIACQTGLAMAGLEAIAIDPRIETGGLIGVLAAQGDDRLVVA